MEILPVPVLMLDREGRIRSANPAVANLAGMDSADCTGRSCTEVLRCVHCGPSCPARVAGDEGRVCRGYPTEIRTAAGRRRSVVIDAVPLGEGHVAVVLRDVTESERLRISRRDRWVFHGLVCASAEMKYRFPAEGYTVSPI